MKKREIIEWAEPAISQAGQGAKRPVIIEAKWLEIKPAKAKPAIKSAKVKHWPWWVIAPLMLLAAIGHPGH